MNSKLGKVFLSAEKDNENAKPKLLESVYFCNQRQHLVDSSGNVSPLHEKHTGKPYSVKFNITQKDKNGAQVECKGELKLFYHLGQIPHQDFDSCLIANQEMMEWLKSHGPFSKDDNRIYQCLKGSLSIAAICPGAKLSEMRMVHRWLLSAAMLDECMDKGSIRKGTTFKALQSWELLEGTAVLEGSTLQKILKLPVPYQNYAAANQDFRKEILSKGSSAKELIKAFKEFHFSLALESSQEWKEKQENKNSFMYRPTQSELRFTTIAAIIVLELAYFDRGLQLPKSLRESFLYKMLVRACCLHTSLVNDLFSLKKEMRDGETSNALFLYHENDGLPLRDAYEKAVNEINFWKDVLNEAAEFLVQLFPEYEETGEVVAVVRGFAHGNLQWHTFTDRYHKDVIVDCVIEA